MSEITKTIRWGIIGCGNVTEVKSGPAYQKTKGFTISAVMRRDSEKVADYAKHVTETLKRHNIRVHLDDRNEKLPAKIRDAQLQKIPYMLIVGAKEAEAGTVSVRHRSRGDLGPKPLAEVVDALQKEVESRLTS